MIDTLNVTLWEIICGDETVYIAASSHAEAMRIYCDV